MGVIPTKVTPIMIDWEASCSWEENARLEVFVHFIDVVIVRREHLKLRFCAKNQNHKFVLDTESKQIVMQPKKV